MKAAAIVLLALIAVVAECSSRKLNVAMGNGPDVIKTPLPYYTVDLQSLPSYWDIRNVSGVNMANPIRSQMVPQYCGSCWAFATTSSLSDRLKLQRNAAYPDWVLAPQVLLNCALESGLYGCNGGSAHKAMEYIHKHNISDETCAPYIAAGMACDSQFKCSFCDDGGYGCAPVKHYQTFTVSEYGKLPISGTNQSTMVAQMMAEIYARGPIACLVEADDWFDHGYKGGIITPRKYSHTNHVVTVSGWGSEEVNGTEVPYWIVRNSYGSWWGEQGWFRIQRGLNVLGIETECAWGVPVMNPMH